MLFYPKYNSIHQKTKRIFFFPSGNMSICLATELSYEKKNIFLCNHSAIITPKYVKNVYSHIP